MSVDAFELDTFAAQAERWLADRCDPADESLASRDIGTAVFHSLPHDEEARLIRAAAQWQSDKYIAGYGALTWPAAFGGAGLTPEHERVFQGVERRFDTPSDHELRRITTNLVAPTLRSLGSDFLQASYIRPFLNCSLLVCQLFSEPGAGSDLASVATRATQSGSAWVVNGSKVWVSGAQFADYGLLLARTDTSKPKHRGISAFLLDLSVPGVEIRPIRQMTGGSSFNEVFFDDVMVDERMLVGDLNEGWTVARSMLTFERNQSGARSGVGGSWEQLSRLAAAARRRPTPAIRDYLAGVFMAEFLRGVTRQRAELVRRAGGTPGPEGSLGKLLWARNLIMLGEAASMLAGPDLVAELSEPVLDDWSEHVLGAPGFRIAGGSDEIQHNIIAEQILGLPRGAF